MQISILHSIKILSITTSNLNRGTSLNLPRNLKKTKIQFHIIELTISHILIHLPLGLIFVQMSMPIK